MTPFEDLHDYIAIPRVSGLRLSPDGSWLAATVQQLGPDGKTFVPAIWRIPVTDGPDGGQAPDPPGGQSLPTRLTWSAQGEDNPAFLPDGSLLFTSARPDLAAWQDSDVTQDGAKPALWLHPAGGGDARRLAAPPGGISGTSAATGAPALVLTCPMLPGADGPDEDAKRRQQRKDAGVTAILHEAPRVRHWDHDLGPDQLRLLMATAANGGLAAPPRDLTPDPGRALDEQRPELTPDGSLAVTGWSVWDDAAEVRAEIAVIDTATGQRRTLLSDPGRDYSEPHISPDGRLVVCTATTHDSYDAPGDATLVVVPLDGSGSPADLLGGLDRRPVEAVWAPGSQAVYFTADDHGRCPVFRASLDGAPVTRVTTDDGAYTSLCPSPDGRFLYALRSAVDSPPAPVRLDLTMPGTPPRHPPRSRPPAR